MAEDFGDFGDEALLERDEYLLEVAELEAMDYQERENILREMAEEAEDSQEE